MFDSTKARLLIGVVLINAFIYVLIAAALYQNLLQYRERTELSTQNLTRSLEQTIEGTIGKLDVHLQAVVHEVERQLATGKLDAPALNAYVRQHQSQTPEIDAIRIADAEGNVRYGTGIPSGKPVNIEDRDYYQLLRDNPQAGLVFSKPLVGRITGKWSIIIARRLNHPGGRFAGVILTLLPLDYFHQIISGIDVGKRGAIAIRNLEYAILARHPETEEIDRRIGSTAMSAKSLEMLENFPDAGTYTTRYKHDGIERTLSYRRINSYPFYIFTGLATYDTLAPWHSEIAVILGLAVLFTLVTVLSARASYRRRLAEAHDMEALRESRDSLEQHRCHLEELVAARTAELLTAKNIAETSNVAKSTFLANMSHELRTPLNAILGFSSLMRQDAQLRPKQRSNLDIINRSGEHLLTLINDILEMSKIEAGKTQLNITAFDFGALVRDVTDMMELRAHAKGLRLLLDQSSEFPRYIMGDEARLRQILINLLGNAVKFTEQGGVTLRLRTRQNAIAHLIIEIEDSGPGISHEDQQRLFQPFMQFGKQPGDNQGTGLGLSITRQFVQLMGGSISATSTLGKGSLFRVDLPLNEVKDAKLFPQQESEKCEVIGLAPDQPVYRILIVEDQLENQLLLSQLMQRIGFEFKVAQDGKQGVELFQSWQPHLIFMDRRMPDMDGIEATKIIRHLPGGKDVKIVAVTASAFMEQRDEVMAAGMDDFVRKPYHFEEIYDCLSKHLGLHYRYAQAQLAEGTTAVPLTPEMLAVLPLALRRELHDALERLEMEHITTILRQVEPFDAKLHSTLSRLAASFDYPAILKVLPTDY